MIAAIFDVRARKPFAKSVARVWLVSSHPSVATIPSRASIPAANRPGWASHADANHSGRFNAALPTTNRANPSDNIERIESSSRIPPPN
jgi:hypothetical protein